jgi:hypothetical protein
VVSSAVLAMDAVEAEERALKFQLLKVCNWNKMAMFLYVVSAEWGSASVIECKKIWMVITITIRQFHLFVSF